MKLGILLLAFLYGEVHSMITSTNNGNFYPNLMPLSFDMINYVNNVAKTTWTAGPTKRFKSVAEAKRLLGVIRDPNQPKPPELYYADNDVSDVPDTFDSRQQWPNCTTIKEVWDQSNCGSCWAFGAVEAMSDRRCIATKGKFNRRLSTEQMVSCCSSCGMGCNGGELYPAWRYYQMTGLVTGGLYGDTNCCQPYVFPPCDHHVNGTKPPCQGDANTPNCVQQCQPGYNTSFSDDKYFGQSSYAVKTVPRIQQEIMTNGPVEAAFDVYADFLTYKSGVYQHTAGSLLGGHAIKILGWGVQNNVPYWLVANSWNEEWGDQGFFKILRGKDECGIESDIVAGLPKI